MTNYCFIETEKRIYFFAFFAFFAFFLAAM
jgi:hypothetical protein